jgi:hypothetical protein
MFAAGYGMAKAEGADEEDAIISGATMLYLHYGSRLGPKVDQVLARREARTALTKASMASSKGRAADGRQRSPRSKDPSSWS